VLPEGWSGPALRHRLLQAQLALDELAEAAGEIAEQGGDQVHKAARIAGHIARREYPAALYAAQPLLARSDHGLFAPRSSATAPEVARALKLLGDVVLTMPTLEHSAKPAATLAAVESRDSALARLARAAVDFVVLEAEADDLPDSDSSAEDFAPVVMLTPIGGLPGSAVVAGKLAARGGRWNPLRNASLTTRQAVQVAIAGTLAIILGREVSEARYYWAVIAAFVTFAGTATSSETSLKAANRVVGTLVGLGLAIGLAELTAGHTLIMLALIVLCMMCGFYLITVSYAGMILFVTIMVAQLYSALHEFTPGFLVLRLEETALGAAIGIAVGLFVLPTSTRDTVDAAERAFLDAVAAVFDATADAWEGAPADRISHVRMMEDRMRQLALTARPLTRPLLSGNPTAMRCRVASNASAARSTRAIAAVPIPAAEREAFAVAQAFRALGRTVTQPVPQHADS
jgi:hypothetical protein